jgi:hypothetical protein
MLIEWQNLVAHIGIFNRWMGRIRLDGI